MKIQKKEASKVFQPITLEIVIESEEELRMLRQLSKDSDNISAALEDANFIDEESEEYLCGFLGSIYLLICK